MTRTKDKQVKQVIDSFGSGALTRRQFMRRLMALGGLSVATQLGIGCAPSPSPAADTGPAAQPAPSPTPATRGGVAVPVEADPLMNPVIGWRAGADMVNNTLYTPLTRPDPETLLPVGYVASSWETSEDGLTWTFHLREGIQFHDGQPLTAEDVKFTYEQILLPENGSPWRANFEEVESMEVVDPLTIKFHLANPVASLASLMHDRHGIVPRHLLEGKDITTATEFNQQNPVGSGPFKFGELESGSHVTLEANDGFFLGSPGLDSVTFKVVPDRNVQLAQLKAGELSVALVQPDSVAAVEDDPQLTVETITTPGWFCIFLNNSDPWFQDIRVRRAMAHGLDRKSIFEAALGGRGDIAIGPYPPGSYYYNPNIEYYEYDPAKAQGLLKEAGWEDHDGDGIIDKDGEPFRFTIYLETGQALYETIGSIAQANYAELGMDVDFEQVEFNEFIDKRFFGRQYKVMHAEWYTGPDPDVLNFFHSSTAQTGFNVQMFEDAEIDRLLEEGRSVTDPEKRREVYWELQELLVEKVPVIFLFHPLEIRAWDARLAGYSDIQFRIDWLWSANIHYVS